MKKLLRNNEEVLELDIEVRFYKDDIAAASVLDTNNPDFQAFELDLLETISIYHFVLIEESKSSNKNSKSRYYTFIKTNEDGTRLKIYLKIRISDHTIDYDKTRDIPSYSKRDQKYISKQAEQYAQQNFGQPRGYRAKRIDIVFNDENYTSYDDALEAVQDRLDRFDRI